MTWLLSRLHLNSTFLASYYFETSISIHDLAVTADIDVDGASRIMRTIMHRVSQEEQPGYFATLLLRLLFMKPKI